MELLRLITKKIKINIKMNQILSIFVKKQTTCELKPMGVRTVNAHFLNIPKDDKFIRELSESRKSVEGILKSTDIIKDTFKQATIV